MTSSMAAALLLTAEITGERTSVSEIVSPQRFSPRELAKTAAMGAKAVKYIGKRLFQIPKSTVRDLKPGHGAVVRTAAGKMGVYRDEEGKFHAVSPRPDSRYRFFCRYHRRVTKVKTAPLLQVRANKYPYF